MVSDIFDLSEAKYLGLKKGASAPILVPKFLIFLLSVFNIILSIYFDFFRVLIGQNIKGFELSFFKFLNFKPLLPILAGTIPIIFLLFINVLFVI